MEKRKVDVEFSQRGQKLLASINSVHEVARRTGFSISAPTSSSLALLKNLPDSAAETISNNLDAYLEIISTINGTLDLKSEIKITRKALSRWGFTLEKSVPGDLDDLLESNHLIEVYDANGIQLYRNLEFFRYCSYSLLELALIDWTTLYERPTRTNELILEKVKECFATGRVIETGEIPDHILRERYLTAKKAFLIKIKRLIPLAHESDPSKKALISVMSAELIASGDEASKIQYI